MSDIPIRAISLKQNLQTGSILKAQFVQSETKSGLWQICVRDISIIFNSDINIIAEIQCNLVKDLKFNNLSSGLQSYNPTISTFLMKGKANEKKFFQIEKCWFQVNAPNSKLKLYFRDAETEILINNDCKIIITILIQRIK